MKYESAIPFEPDEDTGLRLSWEPSHGECEHCGGTGNIPGIGGRATPCGGCHGHGYQWYTGKDQRDELIATVYITIANDWHWDVGGIGGGNVDDLDGAMLAAEAAVFDGGPFDRTYG